MKAKAITIRQPWAWAILAGHKGVENRGWSTSYRGPLLVHAGLKVDRAGYSVLERIGVQVPQDLPSGVILGVVDLVDVGRWQGSRRGQAVLFDPYELADDPLAVGPVCWILRNPRLLVRPIPCIGRRGLWGVELEPSDLC